MKKYKRLACLFAVLAVLLSDIMCAAVAYQYCALRWGSEYAGYGAPACIAFLLCIPYGAGMILCFGLAWFFQKKHRKFL